jgi:hypothetical protein
MLKFKNKLTFLVIRVLLFIMIISGFGVNAQNDYSIFKESRKLMALSVDLNSGIYRDFSTSPLFFEIPGLGITFSGIYNTDKSENRFDIDANFMAWDVAWYNFNTYYHYLHHIPIFKTPKWNLKIGGAILFSQNFRNNTALQNAQIGYESLANLMLVGKISRDLSILEPKLFKCWFIKGTKKPCKSAISFQMNVGVLNFNHRPSTYNYVYLGAIYGTALSLDSFLKEYQWKLNGWRLGTQVDYTWYYPSGNGRRISYIWEAAHAPGSFESFQMAIHKIQFTILINNKKK